MIKKFRFQTEEGTRIPRLSRRLRHEITPMRWADGARGLPPEEDPPAFDERVLRLKGSIRGT